jgi:hypothetical protein
MRIHTRVVERLLSWTYLRNVSSSNTSFHLETELRQRVSHEELKLVLRNQDRPSESCVEELNILSDNGLQYGLAVHPYRSSKVLDTSRHETSTNIGMAIKQLKRSWLAQCQSYGLLQDVRTIILTCSIRPRLNSEALRALSMMRKGIRSAASSRARVRPVGPAPTMRTSIADILTITGKRVASLDLQEPEKTAFYIHQSIKATDEEIDYAARDIRRKIR